MKKRTNLNIMEIKVLLALIKRANNEQLKGVAEIITDKTNYAVKLPDQSQPIEFNPQPNNYIG